MPGEVLRVLDFGSASALRSQTLWHAVAYGVSAGAPPTLSLVRPAEPYVSIGYHRRLEEVDLEHCRARGLPVFRRMVGGGPVYLDDRQLFFQITLPARRLPPVRRAALRLLLEPAVEAFRAAGVPASLDEDLEVVVDDRKVSGHGAGQIEDAAVVVGNLIEGFDHRRAARVLALPHPLVRREALRLMRRFVGAWPADPAAFAAALEEAYARALGLRPRRGEMTGEERRRLRRLDRRFMSPSWLRGPARPAPPWTTVKVRAGVWVLAAEADGTRVVLTAVRGRAERVVVDAPGPKGGARGVGARLQGRPLREVVPDLSLLGRPWTELAGAVRGVTGRWG